MRRPSLFLTLSLIWLLAEILAFYALVHVAGLSGAILLGLLTSVAGFAMLRRLGHGAAKGLKKAIDGEEVAEGAMLDGTLAALGSLLLIIPGFLSDLVGLGLAAPSLRQWLAGRFGAKVLRPRRKGPNADVIELTPDDWTAIDEPMRQTKAPERS
jgi:UPF0716 protein FxsA